MCILDREPWASCIPHIQRTCVDVFVYQPSTYLILISPHQVTNILPSVKTGNLQRKTEKNDLQIYKEFTITCHVPCVWCVIGGVLCVWCAWWCVCCCDLWCVWWFPLVEYYPVISSPLVQMRRGSVWSEAYTMRHDLLHRHGNLCFTLNLLQSRLCSR